MGLGRWWRRTFDNEAYTRELEEEALHLGFWKAHGVPTEEEVRKLSVLRLAELLFHEKNEKSVAYIVLSHELQTRMLREQTKAIARAGYLRFFGLVLGPIIGGVVGSLLTYLVVPRLLE